MTDERPNRVETLVAIDWDDQGRDINPVRDFVGDALVGTVHERVMVYPSSRPAREVSCWRVSFDAARVRNTDVHGAGHRAGFVSHIES